MSSGVDVQHVRAAFELRMQGYDLSKTEVRGFYLNRFVYRAWQDFYAGFLAALDCGK